MAGPVLLCAATARELEAAAPAGEGPLRPGPALRSPGCLGRESLFAVTGVGIPLTLARLQPLLAEYRPSLVVNFGIAGAYPGSGLAIGDLAAGESEVFGDLGMETPDESAFLPLGGMPWADAEYRRALPLTMEPWGAPRPGAGPGDPVSPRRAKGCTVNACAGRAATGALRRRLFGADFESMEGAAAALAGALAGIPVAEIRAVSNFASDRDMRPENLELALRNLGVYLRAWMEGRA